MSATLNASEEARPTGSGDGIKDENLRERRAGSLFAVWSGPARRRALLHDAMIGVAAVLAAAALAARAWGWTEAVVTLVIGLALAGVVVAWRMKRFDRAWLIRRLDQRRADMDDSAELLFADLAGLGRLQVLQRERLLARLRTGSPQALAYEWSWRSIAVAWGLAAVVVVGAVVWPRAGTGAAALAPAAEGAAAPGVPHLVAQNLRIIPPAYTGLPARDEAKLDAQAPQGSRLEWTLRFDPQATVPAVVVVDGVPLGLSRAHTGGDGDWTASRVLDASFLYRVEPVANARIAPPLHRIDAIADTPPQVKALSPTDSLTLTGVGQRSWTPVFAATDDYGVLASARLKITLAIGEGENVTFSEREIPVSGGGAPRDRRFAPRLDFAALGFGPGSDMVVQLIVSDTRSPGPQVVRGPSLILRWPSARAPESSGMQGLVNVTLPAYFRSQRQIIIDAEAVLAQKRRLAPDRYLARSMSVGDDQQILRGRYSQFLGGENEGQPQDPTSDRDSHVDADGEAAAPSRPGFGAPEDVLAEFGHVHDDAPSSMLDPEVKAILKQAVDEMWQSELQLKQGRPDLALPYANNALRFIKQVQQATRVFLNRVGPELPPIDAARRMTGKREGLASRVLGVEGTPAGDVPAAEAWRALGETQGFVALDGLDRWVRQNAGRLPDPLAVTSALDAVRSEPGCQACHARLRALLWTAMERPPAQVARREPADAQGARYLDGLAGGAP